MIFIWYKCVHIWRPRIEHIRNILIHILIFVAIRVHLRLLGLSCTLMLSHLPLALILSIILNLHILLLKMRFLCFNRLKLVLLILFHVYVPLNLMILFELFLSNPLHPYMLPILQKPLFYQEVLLLNFFHLLLRSLQLIFEQINICIILYFFLSEDLCQIHWIERPCRVLNFIKQSNFMPPVIDYQDQLSIDPLYQYFFYAHFKEHLVRRCASLLGQLLWSRLWKWGNLFFKPWL